MAELLKKIPPWGYLIMIGFVIFYTHDITVSNDMGSYMNQALNIYTGKGYTDMDGSLVLSRGPIFPVMIAFSYLIFGISPWSAFWVVRIFCILTPIMIYFLGKKLSGKWVGFSAALLILTSYSINYWAYRHLDAVWPFFVFLAIYLIYEGLEKEPGKPFYFVFAGICLGIGFLVKEVVILFFALPLMLILVIRQFRRKSNFRYIFILYSALFLFISPWILYQVYNNGTFLGKAAPVVIKNTIWEGGIHVNALQTLTHFLKGIYRFYHAHSNSADFNFLLAPLFVLAIGYAVYRAIAWKNKSYRAILVAVIPFLPIMQSVGNVNFRLGQVLYFYCLSFLLISLFAYDISKALAEKLKKRKKKISISLIFSGLILILTAIQVFIPYKRDRAAVTFFKQSYAAHIFAHKKERKIHRLYTREHKELSREIWEVLPDKSRVLVGDDTAYITYWKALSFFNRAQSNIFKCPFIVSIGNIEKLIFNSRKKNDLILIDSKWGNTSPLNYFKMLFEQDLHHYIREHHIKYIITENSSPLTSYFKSNTNFLVIKTIESKRLVIFQVDQDLEKAGFKPIITNKAIRYYKKLSEEKPGMVNWLVEHFFHPLLGLDRKGTDRLFSSTGNI